MLVVSVHGHQGRDLERRHELLVRQRPEHDRRQSIEGETLQAVGGVGSKRKLEQAARDAVLSHRGLVASTGAADEHADETEHQAGIVHFLFRPVLECKGVRSLLVGSDR